MSELSDIFGLEVPYLLYMAIFLCIIIFFLPRKSKKQDPEEKKLLLDMRASEKEFVSQAERIFEKCTGKTLKMIVSENGASETELAFYDEVYKIYQKDAQIDRKKILQLLKQLGY